MALLQLPLFPLDIVVLPFEEVPLHIFEPRYKGMVKTSLAQDKPFGIVFKDNRTIDSIGCSVEITQVLKTYTTGEYDIVVTGKKRFKIMNRTKNGDLWVGHVEFFHDQDKFALPIFQVQPALLGGLRIIVDGECFDSSYMQLINNLNI